MAGRSARTSNGTPTGTTVHAKSSPPNRLRPSPLSSRGSIARACAWLVDHQIHISVTYLLAVFLIHTIFPAARRRTRPLFELSHRDPVSGKYTRGWDDLSFVGSWTMIIMGLRVAMMDYVLKPFAYRGGVRSEKQLVRFAEQAWLVVYYSISWPLGMYIMYHSKYWLNLHELWTEFPTREMDGLLKWYYLVQFAFWLQQIVVVHIEERRKDHWQMFSHHIVTCTLVSASYMYYQMNVGNVVLCIMDLADIFLSAAKNLRYLKYRTACDVCFGVFIITWLFTRHFCYLIVCYSIYAHVPSIMQYGCYDSVTGARVSPDGGSEIFRNVFQSYRDPDGVVCFNSRIRWWFLALLVALQLLLVIWFSMIVRVAVTVLSGNGAEDTRSEDEMEDEEEERDLVEEVEGKGPQAYVEEEVDGDAVHFASTRPYRKSSVRASGISIAGHGDRKELLGRIGCDKPS